MIITGHRGRLSIIYALLSYPDKKSKMKKKFHDISQNLNAEIVMTHDHVSETSGKDTNKKNVVPKYCDHPACKDR